MSLRRNTAWGLVGQGITSLAAFATSVVLARWLAPDVHGQVQAVLALWPLVAVAGPTPGVDEVAVGAKAQHLGRGEIRFLIGNRIRSVQEPRVVLSIDRNAGDFAEPPLRGHARPTWVAAKRRDASRQFAVFDGGLATRDRDCE